MRSITTPEQQEAIEGTPEFHFAHTPSITAAQIAKSQIHIAYADCAKAWHQIDAGNTDEAIAILAEAREELEAAQNMLSGRVWTLEVAGDARG